MSRKSKHDYDDPMGYAAADTPAAPPEVPPEDRARALMLAMSEAQRHNAPITLSMLNEMRDLITAITGITVPAPLHHILDSRGQHGNVTVRKPDGAVEVIDSVEEALAYVRTLPIEVQKQPHWVAADKALAEAMTYVHGADVSPAVRQFETAVAKDRDQTPRTVEVPERDPSLEPPKPVPAPEPEPAHA